MTRGRGATDARAVVFPPQVFDAPLLRGLDERGRGEVARAGRVVTLAPNERLFERGAKADALYVVAEGALELAASRRDERPRPLRRVEAGGSCGEEASIGATYRATASAASPSRVAEIPVALLRRALGRAGGSALADRFERRLHRSATRELLETHALGAGLDDGEIDELLDALRLVHFARGETVYREGAPAGELWLVADGMVQLQLEQDDRPRVLAYLVRGDFFGEAEVLAASARTASAVASGPALLCALPAALVRARSARHPGWLRARSRTVLPLAPEAGTDARPAHDALHDLHRLDTARSLLAIDLDHCVRCGHCVWACESTHGVARLSRRGDRLLARLDDRDVPLLLPTSCQHCASPACMPDCPTGAIGREPSGEVFVRENLCTGCGACAKGCPWGNIRMAPRPAGVPAPLGGPYPEIAVKCELCRGLEGPVCVQACPTAAISRLDPGRELPEVAHALRRATPTTLPAPARARASGAGAAAASIATLGLCVAGAVAHARGLVEPRSGLGAACGWGAALCFAAAALYVVPKRLALSRRRRSPEPRPPRGDERVRGRTHYLLHLAVGVATLALAIAHGGASVAPTTGGGLLALLYAAGALGLAAGAAYAWVPRRLTRLERRSLLPEDFAGARRELSDQLYDGISGRSELVKRLFERVLVPYLRRPGGSLWLVLRGRDLESEQRALHRHVDALLEGRGRERLAGLDSLIRLAVELRALGAQRALGGVLRGLVLAHVALAGGCLLLVVVHIARAMSGSP